MASQAKRKLDASKRKRKLLSSRDERRTARAKREAAKFKLKGTRKITKRGRQKAVGASKETKVSKGAVSVKKTKGGEYVKYAKKSKAAGSFRSAFKAGCKGDSKGFSWQGRKYSCAKKSDTKKADTKKKEIQGPPKPPAKKQSRSPFANKALDRAIASFRNKPKS